MHVTKLFDGELYLEMKKAGYVRVQKHPTADLFIHNYTEKAQFDRMWNSVTSQCRGLILDGQGNVVARPFPKFFNYSDPDCGVLDMEAPVKVTDKMDGSLGILYHDGTGWAIATRGSFTSDQAKHASMLLATKYSFWEPNPGWTYLFEIIYPENRIVLDYGGMDDLVYLGRVHIGSGETLGPTVSAWPGKVAHTFEADSLAEALEMVPRDNAEGVVVHFICDPSEKRVKIKQADYVALHRVMTGTNARTLWEFLAVNACQHLIPADKPKHWGSKLKIDPVKAQEILNIGDDWMSKMLKNVPDEFFEWVKFTLADLLVGVRNLHAHITRMADVMRVQQDIDQISRAEVVRLLREETPEHWQATLMALDKQDITGYCWVSNYPPAAKPWQNRNEDVA